MIFDPFVGTKKLENGAYFFEVQDADLKYELGNDEHLRSEYERLKEVNENPLLVEESDMEELRAAVLQQFERVAPQTLDEFNDIMDKEFSVFKEGQKYEFVRDIRDAFADGLAKTEASKILDTIPAHAFWDIKTPKGQTHKKYFNQYNPFRGVPFQSFFEFRQNEEYNDRRILKNNIQDGLSTYRRH